MGMTARRFKTCKGQTGLDRSSRFPDISVSQEALQSEEAAEAMKYDGVRPDTIVGMVEG
jgi:hypothetical protein